MLKNKNNFLLILICVIVFGLYGYIREANKLVEYNGSVTVTVFQSQTQITQFAYQNYYLWQSNNLYLDNIRDIVTTPANIKKIFENANT
ncbi:hypothetical protein COZ61_02345, partial [Candidatus Berkelbacteria bacterium CG_4_8_14_3_um_filter_33_6]